MAKQFEMTGFRHITKEGVVALMFLFETEGTIAMMWDINNQRKADALMLEKDFNMAAYCKKLATNDEELDALISELHEELIDARFTLEYAFVQGLNNISCPIGNRTFSNLGCIVYSDAWVSTSCDSLPKGTTFNTLDELGRYCADACVDRVVTVEVSIQAEGSAKQCFEWRVAVAQDFNMLKEAVCAAVNATDEAGCDIKYSFVAK